MSQVNESNRLVVRRVRSSTALVLCQIETLEARTLLSAAPSLDAYSSASALEGSALQLSHSPIQPFATGQAGPTGTLPAQMRQFYGVDAIRFGSTIGDGRGQTIAIVDAYDDPSALSDLQSFDAAFGLPNPPSFAKVNENGGTNLPSTDPAGPGSQSWEVEESLDVQWAHVIAPQASLILVEANSSSTTDLFQGVATAASLPGVVAVSMSFGGSESRGESQQDGTFTTPAGHAGVTFLAATGDSGAPGDYPAYSPNVVAVGGTTINLGPGGGYGSETAWSGSGGGFSRSRFGIPLEPEPTFQQSVQSSGARSIPDVSIDADPQTGVPVFDSFDFGTATPWAQVGGTSLAAPMWAALVAIADQGRSLAGLSSLDGRSQTLPRLYSLSAADFHDVTSGSNGGFSAGTGYDEVTGLGTPVANLLVPDLAGITLSGSQNLIASTPHNDTITLARNADGADIDWTLDGGPVNKVAINDPNGLMIEGNGASVTIALDGTNGDPLPNLLKLNSGSGMFTIDGLTANVVGNSQTIDIGASTVLISYSGSSPLAAVQAAIKSGYDGGKWDGTGIISTAAAANSGFAVGYADSADGVVSGQPANTIELKYTLAGDANLDGTLNFSDLVILAQHYGSAAATWDQGDFNYDGTVNFSDLVILAQNNQPATASSLAVLTHQTASQVPATDAASTSLAPRKHSSSRHADGRKLLNDRNHSTLATRDELAGGA